MAAAHVSLADVQSGLSRESIVFRLLHFWEARRPTQGNTLMGLEMLLIDEQGTTIQGFIAPNRIARFQPLLKRNSIYRMTNFYATDNKTMYRVADHGFTLCFTDLTAILELAQTAHAIEEQLFKLQSFSKFEAAADQCRDLFDVIGHIKLINGQHLHERPAIDKPTGQKDRVNVHLQLRNGPIVSVYLWDSAASEFLSKFHASPTTPKVLLVTPVNPKRLGASVRLGTMSPSRVFIDAEVAPTQEYLTWLGDNAAGLAVVNTSQVTKLETITIADLLEFIRVQPSQVASFVCKVTISEVLRDAGWFYIACTSCSRKCHRGPTSFVCTNSSKENAVGILKYRVVFLVQDNSGTAVFVFLDDAATPLAGRSATTLMDSVTKDNRNMSSGEEVPFPDCFSGSVGQTHKLIVKLTTYTFHATRKTITVSKILEPEEVAPPTPLPPAGEAMGTNISGVRLGESNPANPIVVGASSPQNLSNTAAGEEVEVALPDRASKRPRLDA